MLSVSEYVEEIMQKARVKKALEDDEGDEDDGEDEEETRADLMEEVADELQSAQQAWAKVCGAGVREHAVPAEALKVDIAGDDEEDGAVNVMDELVTALGSTYCDEVHGSALRSMVTPSLSTSWLSVSSSASGCGGVLTQDAFVDWYVRWVFGDADDDTARVEEESLALSGVCPSDATSPSLSPPAASSGAAGAGAGGSWSSVKWAVAPSSSTVSGVCWTCEVCMVTNKWEFSRCQSCETAAPHAKKAEQKAEQAERRKASKAAKKKAKKALAVAEEKSWKK